MSMLRKIGFIVAAVLGLPAVAAFGPVLLRRDVEHYRWDGAVGAGMLAEPIGIAYADGRLFVSDASKNRIVVFDTSGAVRSILWPDQFALHGDLVEADRIVVVRGVIDRRPGSEEVNLIVNELIPLDELKARYTGGVIIRVDEQKHGERGLAQLREILRGYPGKKTLRLRLALADGTGVDLACDNRRVEPNMEMQRRVDELLGPGNFRLITEPPKVSASPPRGGNGRDRAMAGR